MSSTQPKIYIYCEGCQTHHLPGIHVDEIEEKPERSEVYYTARKDIIRSAMRWSFGIVALFVVAIFVPYFNNRINNIKHLQNQIRVQQVAIKSAQRDISLADYNSCLAERRAYVQGNQRARVMREYLRIAALFRERTAKLEVKEGKSLALVEADLQTAAKYRRLRSTLYYNKLPDCVPPHR